MQACTLCQHLAGCLRPTGGMMRGASSWASLATHPGPTSWRALLEAITWQVVGVALMRGCAL